MRLTTILSLLTTTGLVAAHNGMIDNLGSKSVGVAYAQSDFKGESIQLVQADPVQCFKVGQFPYQGDGDKKVVRGSDVARRAIGAIASVQICKPAKCVLFAGLNCHQQHGYTGILVEGPVDVPNFAGQKAQTFQSYVCGDDVGNIPNNGTVHSHPHQN